jgi:uncharacterized membrane protein
MHTHTARQRQHSPLVRTLIGFSIGLGILAILNRRSHNGQPALHTNSELPNVAILPASLAAGITALTLSRRSRPTSDQQLGDGALHLRETVTIDRSPDELYLFWRNFENLPRFMNHLHEVQRIGDNQSRWVVSGPLGARVEWTAEIINETPNELIAWRSLEGGDIDCAGTVRFQAAPAGRGTIVKVEMQYRPPAGKLGATVARLLGAGPDKQVAVDLRRFKQLIETGEVARTEGQSAGRPRSTSRKFDDVLRS